MLPVITQMEENSNRTKLKLNVNTHRRLNIQHELDENRLKQMHLSNLHSYRYQEDLFHRKIEHLRKSIEHAEPAITGHTNDNVESLMAPNCFKRIQNHFRLLNFSEETSNRLLYQPSSYKKSDQSAIVDKKDNFRRHSLLYQSRPPTIYSYRSSPKYQYSRPPVNEKNTFQTFLNQQMLDEKSNQTKNNRRKDFLLKDFAELKHKIDDPHATFAVLSALSRAILFLDSRMK